VGERDVCGCVYVRECVSMCKRQDNRAVMIHLFGHSYMCAWMCV